MKRLLLLDNHDSFTWNVVRLVGEVSDWRVTVRTNTELRLAEVRRFDKIIFSPGAGVPSDIPLMREILERYAAEKSILGICLGHQAIAEVFGWPLVNLKKVFHGQTTDVRVLDESDPLFRGLPERFQVGLYHSWAAEEGLESLNLKKTAVGENGVLMALAHRRFDVRGVQFHPESYMTSLGGRMMAGWLAA